MCQSLLPRLHADALASLSSYDGYKLHWWMARPRWPQSAVGFGPPSDSIFRWPCRPQPVVGLASLSLPSDSLALSAVGLGPLSASPALIYCRPRSSFDLDQPMASTHRPLKSAIGLASLDLLSASPTSIRRQLRSAVGLVLLLASVRRHP
jgi:hypothetical protein